MQETTQLPPYLRQYVVEQDYAAYTAEDQAVWRFVLLQTYARHLRTAHPAYADGFAAVGISVEEIPQIARMNERLANCGFQAVCVDGFIPPRAFQAFQARGYLPIAADIRTSEHLTYTPAPDIIHEAAGHAPFLASPEYARFLRAIGQAGERAFTTPYDGEVYDAIHSLSELKEDPRATPSLVAAAEARLARLTALAPQPSEAALLSRLYWWTVEYGLIGAIQDYRIFGAGLLSSIGEGYFCHSPEVRKLPLGAACVDVPYDITRPQPQLFVARDFEHLNSVLIEVCDRFAYWQGGVRAVETAQRSAEPATLELGDGLQLAGLVSELHYADSELAAVSVVGDCAFAQDGVVMADQPRQPAALVLLGHLEDGRPLSKLGTDNWREFRDTRDRICLRTRHGYTLEGLPLRGDAPTGGSRSRLLWLADSELRRGNERVLGELEPLAVVLADGVVTTHAALPDGYYAATVQSLTKVPKQRVLSARHARRVALYEEALAALRQATPSQVVETFDRIHVALEADFPEDWLLRWNLLESLAKLGGGRQLAATLDRELEALELRYAQREPIATGLSYLRTLYGGGAP